MTTFVRLNDRFAVNPYAVETVELDRYAVIIRTTGGAHMLNLPGDTTQDRAEEIYLHVIEQLEAGRDTACEIRLGHLTDIAMANKIMEAGR